MKTVLITGANRGTGYGIARAFADRGDRVIALNRTLCREDWLEEIECDIASKTDIERAVKEVLNRAGGIDILINNAGIRRFAPITEISDEDWEASLSTNLSAPLRLIRYTAKALAASKGLIVFIGSHAGEYPFASGVAYSGTKAALHAMAEVAIHDLRYEGIRVCCLSLGAIANRPKTDDDWKMHTSDVGQLLVSLSDLPERVMPAYVEMRPSVPRKSPVSGMESLQYV